MVADASVDAVWSSHSIEHIHSFEVPKALAELRRVLKSDGYLLITLPNLQAVAHYIVNDQLTDELYNSAAGVISPLDIVFGHQASLARGHSFMAHKTGFTAKTLAEAMFKTGFNEVRVLEGNRWDLWAIGMMPETSDQIFEELAEVML
jgi:ubiquinone/menaquinone biosynthesis C-methylase UbiE